MGYNTDNSGTTLTVAEVSAEGKRILDRLRGRDYSHLTAAAQGFLVRKFEEMDSIGSVGVSVKELFFLRDLSEKVD